MKLALMAVQTRATPGVYAMERSGLVSSATFEAISSLPPRCIRKVSSETKWTMTLSSALTPSTIRRACSVEVHSML